MPKRPAKVKTDFSDCPVSSRRGRKSKKETAAEETQTGVDESVESAVSGVLLGEIQYIYLLELQRSRNAIVVLDQEATKFFVKDFNPRTKLLWDKRYVSMSRKCSSFKCILGESTADNVVENVWMYCCSCDQPRSDFVMASGPYINMPHEEWLQLNPGCLHVQALGMAMKRFDDMFSISPSLEQDEDVQDPETDEDPSFISLQSSVISVHPPSHSWGIISTSTQGMKCLTCKSSNLTCAHVKYVTTSLETDSCPDFVSDFNDACLEMANASKSSERGLKCLSYKQISFEKPGAVSRLLPIGDDVLSAIDEADVCPFCGDEPLSIHPAVKQLHLYTQYQREVVYVHNACAETCEHLIPFDGMEKGILNMGNFLLGHDVLRDYLTNFLCGRMPLFTFYSCWKQRQIDGGNLEDGMLSYSKFKFAWYSFLSLIGEDMTGDFICPICQDSPSIVIFDGTGLAFRRSYLPKLEANTTGEQIQGQGETGSRFKDRVMIKHKKTRELLERYCNPQRPLESPAVLLSLLSDHSPPIKTVIDWCGDNNLAPKDLRAMLMSLAKPSPVCALLPAKEEVRLLLEQMKTADVKQEPALLQSLQLFCPVLFNVVKNLQLQERSLPEAFDALLSELWGKSIAPFEGSQQTNDVRPNAPTTTESNSFDECTSYWPHLPTVRSRGVYQQDQKSDRQSCRKLGKAHKILLPGTVTLHCQHAICYGFEIMLQVESPNTIFTILRTRFPIAPDVVIYDFACGLHNYCLNREANFFQHTKFLIDRYHQPNHKGCSLGYNMSLYPQFKTINSQIAEQKNSMLSRIKAQLSYMNPTNFSKHAQMFLWYHNKKKKASLLTS